MLSPDQGNRTGLLVIRPTTSEAVLSAWDRWPASGAAHLGCRGIGWLRALFAGSKLQALTQSAVIVHATGAPSSRFQSLKPNTRSLKLINQLGARLAWEMIFLFSNAMARLSMSAAFDLCVKA